MLQLRSSPRLTFWIFFQISYNCDLFLVLCHKLLVTPDFLLQGERGSNPIIASLFLIYFFTILVTTPALLIPQLRPNLCCFNNVIATGAHIIPSVISHKHSSHSRLSEFATENSTLCLPPVSVITILVIWEVTTFRLLKKLDGTYEETSCLLHTQY